MKTLKSISILLLLLISTISFAQNQKKKTEVDKIKELGKDSIMKLALDLIHFKVDKNYFDVSITANHREVYVNFRNSIKYIPLNSNYMTDFTVSILDKSISYNSISNGRINSSIQPILYKKNEKVLQFIFDVINESNKVGNGPDFNIHGIPEEINITIKEKETYYDVLDVAFGKEEAFKIKKETGEIYDVVDYGYNLATDKDLTDYFINQINTKACITDEVLKKTYKSIYCNIKNNDTDPFHDGEMGWTIYGYSSKGIGFSLKEPSQRKNKEISIYDKNNAIRYYIFKKKNGSLSLYYERHFTPQFFDEQRYKDIVDHFCKNIVPHFSKNIVNKDFSKSDLPSKTYQTLSKMDRGALINLAKSRLDTHLKLIKEKSFNYKGIDIRVLKNSKEFVVYFEQSFKYVPLHSAHYYGFYVNLLKEDISRLNISNEATAADTAYSYYSPSPQDLKKIAFLKIAISYEYGAVTVYEKEKHYDLNYIDSGEKVDKKTGKSFYYWDEISVPPKDPFVEIMLEQCRK